jgi:integrase
LTHEEPRRGNRRSYGTGQLFVFTDKAGRESWYGRWHDGNGNRPKRKIGPKRQPGSREGLTRKQAERELQRRIDSEKAAPVAGVSVSDTTDRLLEHLEAKGRKATTLSTYRSLVKTHLVPHMGDQDVEQVEPEQVEQLMAAMRRDGKGPKLIRSAVILLHQVFDFGRRKGWCASNPCEGVDLPTVPENGRLRFLDMTEVEALLRAVPPTGSVFGRTDRAAYLTAAMAGLRQSELLALRWRDIDWTAGRVRVQEAYVRGHWQTPKSRLGWRSVPMVDRVAGELDRHFKWSAFQSDDDLVFPHPETGRVLDHSGLSRRYNKALREAKVTRITFHELRHTFGTQMAAAGVPLRTLQEWMGIKDYKTMLIYAHYAPSAHENEMAERAFRGPVRGPKPSASQTNSDELGVPDGASG